MTSQVSGKEASFFLQVLGRAELIQAKFDAEADFDIRLSGHPRQPHEKYEKVRQNGLPTVLVRR